MKAQSQQDNRIQGIADVLDIIEERKNQLKGDENVKFEFNRLIEHIKKAMNK